ncbi:MAG: ElyC/SanA/YdcF family protein [Candidatus Dojkabacteria bacterium]|uniref:YdcF family protein n=2 Tax=Candidatus Dojkabacteria TaxID=74243 RepID=A0A952AHP7_9BACT|nr:YdcF family protein [Candidatus Dojkabacteria bacterium]WKZ27811.1 MAG: ElyC/SanA/YdcF family protein [Candidatus Dojkabacteria bacterium]
MRIEKFKRQRSRTNLKQIFSIKLNYKRVFSIVILAGLIFLAVPFTLRYMVLSSYTNYMYEIGDEIPPTRIAIVFGAGLSEYANQPSHILEDRILTAIDLYKAGVVQKIIMSGDNRFVDYNEPEVMINYAKARGVRDLDLQADFAGRRTFDTCLRAKDVFGVHEAILITQEFHLPRALYVCNSIGVKSIGVVADRRDYQQIEYFRLRDTLALLLSFWDLYVIRPEVVPGERIII